MIEWDGWFGMKVGVWAVGEFWRSGWLEKKIDEEWMKRKIDWLVGVGSEGMVGLGVVEVHRYIILDTHEWGNKKTLTLSVTWAYFSFGWGNWCSQLIVRSFSGILERSRLHCVTIFWCLCFTGISRGLLSSGLCSWWISKNLFSAVLELGLCYLIYLNHLEEVNFQVKITRRGTWKFVVVVFIGSGLSLVDNSFLMMKPGNMAIYQNLTVVWRMWKIEYNVRNFTLQNLPIIPRLATRN